MKKYLTAAIVLGAAAALLIFIVPSADLYVLGWILAGCALVLLFMSAGTAIAKKKSKKPSGWKLFAIGDIIIMVLIAIVGLADIISAQDSAAFGPGLLGGVLLYYGLPIFGALLVLELIVYKAVKMFKLKESDNTPAAEMPPRISFPAKDKPNDK